MDQYFTITDDTPDSEPSFTLAKMFYFERFVKMLKVMDVMHYAYLIHDEIFEVGKVNWCVFVNSFDCKCEIKCDHS